MRTIFLLVISVYSLLSYSVKAQIEDKHRFFNFGIYGDLSTNGKDAQYTTNNFALSLIYGHSRNLYGLSIAPFSKVESNMIGLQIGLSQVAANVKGVQLGFGYNFAMNMHGVQVGGFNQVENEARGVQLGFFNTIKSSGVQIGILNSADHNDYPIGIINLIKDGNKNISISIDEMSNVTATFRSGGKYLYGVIGGGYSFSSSLNQIVIELGIGAHVLRTKQFNINTEFTFTHLGRTFIDHSNGEDQAKIDNFDFKNASRLNFRLLPSINLNKNIRVLVGPSINYLISHDQDNRKIFPSHYYWRKFTDKSIKQIHLGYNIGVQYVLK